MATKIPKDLEENGGWEFTSLFKEVSLEKGQIWRKCGAVDAIKIKAVMQDGYSEYDGDLKGISVQMSIFPSNALSVKWDKNGSFIAGNMNQIMLFLKDNGYAYTMNLEKQIA